MNEYALTLDLAKAKQRQQQTIFVRQGDRNATTIVATITDHGAAAATSGLTARFSMRLPDGTHYYRKAASLSGNVATVALDETQAASVAGRTNVAYFQLLQGSTVVASTESFTVIVLPDALADATVPESYDSAIQDAIDNLDAAVENLPSTVEDVLTAHPEWTTTVQDGSVSDAKLYQGTDGILARVGRLQYRLANILTATLPECETATATDAAKTPLAGLALYGRSTQDGTPTPSAPVPIVSVAPDSQGNISLLARGRNLLNPAQEFGGVTYYTVNADGTLTVTAEDTRGWASLPVAPLGAGTFTLSIDGNADGRVTFRAIDGSSETSRGINGNGSDTFTLTSGGGLRIKVHQGTFPRTVRIQVEAGSTAHAYEPYTATVTPIPLDGHELRSLPDGTRDELTVDERGHAVLVQRVQLTTQAVTDGVTGTVGVDVMSSTGAIANGATVLYALATPQTVDLGTIDPVPLVGPDMTAQAVPTAPFALTYERDLNTTLARLESAIADVATS